MTQNPISAFKITIYMIKQAKIQTYVSKKKNEHFRKRKTKKQTSLIIEELQISQKSVLIYIYIYIYQINTYNHAYN